MARRTENVAFGPWVGNPSPGILGASVRPGALPAWFAYHTLDCFMCFSATASFAAAGAVTVGGVTALRSVRHPSQMVVAAIPLFFGIHQFAEGVLWVALSQPAYAAWQRPAMFTFLFFAEVVWPAWVPLAILALEQDASRRKALQGLLILGILLAAARMYGLVAYPAGANITREHIQYHLDSPFLFRRISDVGYALVTMLPPLIAGNRWARFLGLMILLSFVFSKIFFYQTFISVWCFFAALISALVVLIVRRVGRDATPAEAAA